MGPRFLSEVDQLLNAWRFTPNAVAATMQPAMERRSATWNGAPVPDSTPFHGSRVLAYAAGPFAPRTSSVVGTVL